MEQSRWTVHGHPYRGLDCLARRLRGAVPVADCGVCVTRLVRTRSSVAGLLTLTSTACRYRRLTLPLAAGLEAEAMGWVV